MQAWRQAINLVDNHSAKTNLKRNHTVESDTCKISPQVVREVSGQSAGPEESASPVLPRKPEVDKVSVEERMFVSARPCLFLSSRHNLSSQLR